MVAAVEEDAAGRGVEGRSTERLEGITGSLFEYGIRV
jgi:hypothetical protein